MTNAALDRLIWTLIYGALIVLCLGVFLQHPAPELGWPLMGLGAAGAAVGGLLIWVRSRRKP